MRPLRCTHSEQIHHCLQCWLLQEIRIITKHSTIDKFIEMSLTSMSDIPIPPPLCVTEHWWKAPAKANTDIYNFHERSIFTWPGNKRITIRKSPGNFTISNIYSYRFLLVSIFCLYCFLDKISSIWNTPNCWFICNHK